MQLRSLFSMAALSLCVATTQAQDTKPATKVTGIEVPGATKAKKTFKGLLDFTGALGVANYYGDLTEEAKVLNQPAPAITAGVAYYFSPKVNVKGGLTYMQLKASDSKNSRSDLKARNLNFKTNIIEFNTTLEYDFINITGGKRKFSPYIFSGIGLFHFSPTTVDRKGNKQKLAKLGTEGQGLPGYGSPYATTSVQIPMGGGIKVIAADNISIAIEFNYRFLFTDYLDDVSMAGYPDKNALAQKNPDLPGITYRGDELLGGKPYPAPTLHRGNPDKKDVYYTTQFRLGFRLKGKKEAE